MSDKVKDLLFDCLYFSFGGCVGLLLGSVLAEYLCGLGASSFFYLLFIYYLNI